MALSRDVAPSSILIFDDSVPRFDRGCAVVSPLRFKNCWQKAFPTCSASPVSADIIPAFVARAVPSCGSSLLFSEYPRWDSNLAR